MKRTLQGIRADGATEVDGPVGIGGWLILVTIGLVLTSLRLASVLATDFAPLFSDEIWTPLTSPDSPAYNPYFKAIIFYEITGNVIVMLAPVLLLTLLFIQKRSFPKLMIGFLIFSATFGLLDTMLAFKVYEPDTASKFEMYGEVARTILSAAIWIPYFLISKRVKNTFTE
jgi:hypothetical protein